MLRLESKSRFRWLLLVGALASGWTAEALAQCSITGPATVCGSAELCGPGGNNDYEWTGPAGFSSSERCVVVTAPGTYSLRIFDRLNGLWFGPCTHTLVPSDDPTCGTDPPPPPSRASCPRPARWWAARCEDEGGRFGVGGLAAIASCVDERASALSWSDDRAGLCRALRQRDGLRQRARRQLAAALANVCAFAQSGPTSDAKAVGLDPNAEIRLDDIEPTTVGAWLAEANHILASHERRPSSRSARRAYRVIIRVGWAINHGIGVGPVCGRNSNHLSAEEADTEIESLEDELAIEDGMPLLELEGAAPNPFTTSTRIVYFVGTTNDPVEIAVHDVGGRRVRTLVSGRSSPGRHEMTWDGLGDDGRAVRNGLYFIRGRSGQDEVRSTISIVR
jgi:hypothetical protein